MSILYPKNEIYSSSPLEKQLEAYFVQFEQKHTNNIKVENNCETIRTTLESISHQI